MFTVSAICVYSNFLCQLPVVSEGGEGVVFAETPAATWPHPILCVHRHDLWAWPRATCTGTLPTICRGQKLHTLQYMVLTATHSEYAAICPMYIFSALWSCGHTRSHIIIWPCWVYHRQCMCGGVGCCLQRKREREVKVIRLNFLCTANGLRQ